MAYTPETPYHRLPQRPHFDRAILTPEQMRRTSELNGEVGKISREIFQSADMALAKMYGASNPLSNRVRQVALRIADYGIHVGNKKDPLKQEQLQRLFRMHLPYHEALITESGLYVPPLTRFFHMYIGDGEFQDGRVQYTLTSNSLALDIRADKGPRSPRNIHYKVHEGKFPEHWGHVDVIVDERNGKEDVNRTINTHYDRGIWLVQERRNGKMVSSQKVSPTEESLQEFQDLQHEITAALSSIR